MSNPPEEPSTTAGSSQEFNPEAELAELGTDVGKVAHDYPADEVDGWQFDELEKKNCYSSRLVIAATQNNMIITHARQVLICVVSKAGGLKQKH